MEENDPRSVKFDPKYKKLDPTLLPQHESLKDTHMRVQSYYHKMLLPALEKGKTVLVSAHGNSLRALVMVIEHLSAEEIVEIEIPTGVPMIYHYDRTLKIIEKVKDL